MEKEYEEFKGLNKIIYKKKLMKIDLNVSTISRIFSSLECNAPPKSIPICIIVMMHGG